MKKLTVITVMIAGIAFTAFNNPIGTQITFTVDAGKSLFTWTGKKVTGEHTGNVNVSTGKIYINKGLLTGGEIEMDMNSISESEGNERLVGHLKSQDFFDVTNFPKSSFKAKLFSPVKDAKEGDANYTVKGDITIKGITKEIIFPATIKITENEITASADFNIDRTDFGIKFKSNKYDPGLGDKFIYDEFNIKINLVANAK